MSVFGRTRYIEWIVGLGDRFAFDLATSGIPTPAFSELGVPLPDFEDHGALDRFRAGIARYNDCTDAEVVPALGTSHALFLAYSAIASAGDEILVESPGYEPLTRAAEGIGLVVRTFPRPAARGFQIDPEEVAARITPRTRAIVITSLHNPSGVRVPEATMRELARIAEARGAYLLVDEVYAPFDALPEDGVFKASARKLAPNVVAIGSLTKCYGLGDHRVGWVIGPPEVVADAGWAIVGGAGHLPLSHASFGAAWLENIGRLATRTRGLLEGKRSLVAEWADGQPDLQWSHPAEGLFGFATLPGAGDLRERIEAHARTHGVLVGPGVFFDAPEGFRLSWARPTPRELSEALDRLTPLLRR